MGETFAADFKCKEDMASVHLFRVTVMALVDSQLCTTLEIKGNKPLGDVMPGKNGHQSVTGL